MFISGKEFLTVIDMAERIEKETGVHVEPSAIKVRLHRAGEKPLSKDALYPIKSYDVIKNAPLGRPKKAAEPAKAKNRKAKKI